MLIVLFVACLALALSMLVCYAIHVNKNEHLSWLFLVSLPVCFFPLFLNCINTVFREIIL